MKYAIVIPDGAADEPQESLGGKTPLQAARLPNMDQVVRAGVVGRMDNVPRPLTPASDVATLSLFGYDPLQVYTGRAPLEAAALGVTLRPNDWAVRCNLVHVADGQMRDFTSGHITSEEGHQLIGALESMVEQAVIRDETGHVLADLGLQLQLQAGVGYRNLLVIRRRGAQATKLGDELVTQPPHDIPDKPVAEHLPRGAGSEFFRSLMD